MGYFLGKGTFAPSSLANAIKTLGNTDNSLQTGEAPQKYQTRAHQVWRPKYTGGTPLTPEEANATKPDVQQTVGNWAWPKELTDLYSMLVGQGKNLMGKTPGFGQDEIDAMFGRDFSNIRDMERGTRDQTQGVLADQGMLGTGTELDAMQKGAWATEKNVGDAKQNVFLANEAQKRNDITNWTQLASQLLGSTGEFQATQEALNASRRNEANQMLALMLQFYGQGAGR